MEIYAGLITIVAALEAVYIFVQRRNAKHANDPVGQGSGGGSKDRDTDRH